MAGKPNDCGGDAELNNDAMNSSQVGKSSTMIRVSVDGGEKSNSSNCLQQGNEFGNDVFPVKRNIAHVVIFGEAPPSKKHYVGMHCGY